MTTFLRRKSWVHIHQYEGTDVLRGFPQHQLHVQSVTPSKMQPRCRSQRNMKTTGWTTGISQSALEHRILYSGAKLATHLHLVPKRQKCQQLCFHSWEGEPRSRDNTGWPACTANFLAVSHPEPITDFIHFGLKLLFMTHSYRDDRNPLIHASRSCFRKRMSW